MHAPDSNVTTPRTAVCWRDRRALSLHTLPLSLALCGCALLPPVDVEVEAPECCRLSGGWAQGCCCCCSAASSAAVPALRWLLVESFCGEAGCTGGRPLVEAAGSVEGLQCGRQAQ